MSWCDIAHSVKRIVALFEIGTILEDHPAVIWDRVLDYMGGANGKA